ncbi:hypothetical protein HBO07_25660 [Pseudomonas proteolytica]|uniref:hypothetical protein n=1 Tax=Pseudomonas proteolytica TaxID=219574 RepID=UPI001473C098|nr:hypothetical protein [Pseudomonas proteolytica]NMZ14663.1 hypothetical protein [Pseudomonas proteolytica]
MIFRQREAAAKVQCYDWNAEHQEGVTVIYEERLGWGETIQTKTCGRAFVMCCEPVIMVEYVSGAVSLDHCTVVAEHAAA